MKKKTIEKILRDKMNVWLGSILDEGLRTKVGDSLMVSGGCIANLFLKEPVNDFDVYIQDMDVLIALAEYYTKSHHISVLDGRMRKQLIEEFITDKYEDNGSYEYNDGFVDFERFNMDSSIGAVILRTLQADQVKLHLPNGGEEIGYDASELDNGELPEYRPIYFSPNAITLSDDLQIVTRFSGSPEQIHTNYDFVHATNYFTMKDGLVLNEKALTCLLTRELIYQGSKYPITSVIRTKKFINRGYTITAGEYLKMCYQISELDLKNPDVMEEQMIGVDIAYFDKLISIMRGYDESKGSYQGFLFAMIEKIFGE